MFDPDFDIDDLNISSSSPPPGPDISLVKHALEPDPKRLCLPGQSGYDSDSSDELLKLAISNSLQDNVPIFGDLHISPPCPSENAVEHALEPEPKRLCISGKTKSDLASSYDFLKATSTNLQNIEKPNISAPSTSAEPLQPGLGNVCLGKTGYDSDTSDELLKLAISNSLQDSIPPKIWTVDSEDDDIMLSASQNMQESIVNTHNSGASYVKPNFDSEDEIIRLAVSRSLQDVPSTSAKPFDSSQEILDFNEPGASKCLPHTNVKQISKPVQEPPKNRDHFLSESDDSDDSHTNNLDVNSVPSVSNVSKLKGKATREKKKKPAKIKPDKSEMPLCHLKANDALKYVTMVVDSNFEDVEWGKNALKELVDTNYRVETLQDPFTIRWVAPEGEQRHLLFVYDMSKISPMVTTTDSEYFYNFFKSAAERNPNYKLYLVIYGFKEYSRKNKSKRCTRGILETKLLDLLISFDFSMTSLYYETVSELALYLKSLTKAVAQEPNKELTYQKMTKIGFFPEKPKLCVKLDKTGIGMKELWIHHLSLFHLSTLDMAKAIAKVYSSPKELMEAYDTKSTQEERDSMLKDIMVHKSNGRSRRIGPELSKRISTMYNSNDPNSYV